MTISDTDYKDIQFAQSLGWLLDSSESHGLGNYFVKKFFVDCATKTPNLSYFKDGKKIVFTAKDLNDLTFEHVSAKAKLSQDQVAVSVFPSEDDLDFFIDTTENAPAYFKELSKRHKDSKTIYFYIGENKAPENWIKFKCEWLIELVSETIKDKNLNPKEIGFVQKFLSNLKEK